MVIESAVTLLKNQDRLCPAESSERPRSLETICLSIQLIIRKTCHQNKKATDTAEFMGTEL